MLEDPKGAFPAYDALVLISPDRAADERLARALEPLVGAIDVEAMREANLSVDRARNKLSPAEAARALSERLQLPSPRT